MFTFFEGFEHFLLELFPKRFWVQEENLLKHFARDRDSHSSIPGFIPCKYLFVCRTRSSRRLISQERAALPVAVSRYRRFSPLDAGGKSRTQPCSMKRLRLSYNVPGPILILPPEFAATLRIIPYP